MKSFLFCIALLLAKVGWTAPLHPDSLFDRGYLFFDHGAYDRALKDFFGSLEQYEESGKADNLIKTYNAIGRTYGKINDHHSARE